MNLGAAIARGPVVLDGGLATELERRGHDLSDRLWSARLLRDDPGAISAVHEDFLAAGAQVVTTASYQATYDGFAAVGIDRTETDRLLRRSVALAREAAEQRAAGDPELPGPWVAGSIGPYGAMLADGSEYTGDYGPDVGLRGLREFHRPRMEVLAAAGADVLACETVPSLVEAEALLAEVAALGVPAWLSLTVEGDRTRRGERVVEAFRMAADVDAIVAAGVNCCEPGRLSAVLRQAHEASGKPAVVYPNRGESWDAVRRVWVGGSKFRAVDARDWVDAGARLVGGCCRVYAEDIRDLANAVHGSNT